MKIGKVSLNVAALADISEQAFYELVKGKIEIDKSKAWEMFSKEAEPFKTKVEAKVRPVKPIEEPKE